MRYEMNRTTVIVAGNHPLLRDGIVQFLAKQDDIEVVGQAVDGEEMVKLVTEMSPEIVVMDTDMPKIGGLEATRQIKATHPQTSVLALTIRDDEEYVVALFEAGAAGYLLKSICGEELAQAIRAVRLGQFVLDPQVGRRVFGGVAPRPSKPLQPEIKGKLSAREIDVIRLVAQGMSNSEIAEALQLTLQMVKRYLVEAFAKLGVRSRTEAIVVCLRAGILSLDDTSVVRRTNLATPMTPA